MHDGFFKIKSRIQEYSKYRPKLFDKHLKNKFL